MILYKTINERIELNIVSTEILPVSTMISALDKGVNVTIGNLKHGSDDIEFNSALKHNPLTTMSYGVGIYGIGESFTVQQGIVSLTGMCASIAQFKIKHQYCPL